MAEASRTSIESFEKDVNRLASEILDDLRDERACLERPLHEALG